MFRGLRSLLLLGVPALVALAACGSGSGYGAAPAVSPTSTAAASSRTAVRTLSSAKFGTVLTDDAGHTLYTLTHDGMAVACTGQCASAWPPLTLPSGTTNAQGVTGLATVAIAGGMQVTHDGLPLYRFSGDGAPGDTHGEGITAFGGVWHVVTPSAAATTMPSSATSAPSAATNPPAAATTTTMASYGGYGY